ncbi:hypothetical protein LEP1GSC058_2713 [Leptospira fainei serovar Hurstbridge str. BUT 6]|uniref:Uncharacterized protein n=1 Tax=Leptospira fainei serovar Hurstbridge str. BUT 6 TaxID=1193011 RepID=S3V9J9_9LEPT|nr:hypothetical protein LEP1GSC058_2713 [Leptospira fainei serovar Hurstbridge str. BUT 6]
MNVNLIFRKRPQTASENMVTVFFPKLFYGKFSRVKTPSSKFDPSVFGFLPEMPSHKFVLLRNIFPR